MRLAVTSVAFLATALCLLMIARDWGDPVPLLIDGALVATAGASVPTPPPGEEPVAYPDPDLLFTPCPITPRNIPQAMKRTA